MFLCLCDSFLIDLLSWFSWDRSIAICARTSATPDMPWALSRWIRIIMRWQGDFCQLLRECVLPLALCVISLLHTWAIASILSWYWLLPGSYVSIFACLKFAVEHFKVHELLLCVHSISISWRHEVWIVPTLLPVYDGRLITKLHVHLGQFIWLNLSCGF